jgi:hypothetical protein
MGNKWILDVLADLKAFAEANDLPRLANQIELTSIVAAAEIIAGPDPRKGDIGDVKGVGQRPGEGAGRWTA